MGALKGRFQCLRGLRVDINSNEDHVQACRWMTVCIILHNLIIDVEGVEHTQAYVAQHGATEEEADHGARHPPLNQVDDDDEANAKRKQLIAELIAFKSM